MTKLTAKQRLEARYGEQTGEPSGDADSDTDDSDGLDPGETYR